MSEIILGNNGDKYMVAVDTGELLMNEQTKLCPFHQDNTPCAIDCMHLNIYVDGVNKFALLTCTGTLVKIRLVGGVL